MSRSISFPAPLVLLGGAAAVALAAVLAFRGGAPPAPAEQPAKDKGSVAGADETPADGPGDPLTPLRSYLTGQASAGKADVCAIKGALKGYETTCVIATVPHPMKSGLGYWYDLCLDAVERAVEAADYVPDRAWIPPTWRPAAEAATAKAASRDKSDEQPGVLLFRDKNDAKKLCVVWLVGETPTAGVEKMAFAKALQYMQECGVGDNDPLRVLGPFFSGSQASLIAALKPVPGVEADRGAPFCARLTIRNGSATAICIKDFDELKGEKSWLDVDYRTTVIPNSVTRQVVYEFLANPSQPGTGNLFPPGAAAVLYEADTGFGAAGRRGDKDRTPAAGCGAAGPDADADRILIPFPLHVSALQGAHNKELADQLAQLNVPRAVSAASIPQEEGAREGETRTLVRAQSPLTTAAVNDLILEDTLASLGRASVRYVELIATDPRDKILLATLVRDRCPDTQLLTTEGDYLFAHSDFNASLHGMILGSSYPMDASAFDLLPDGGAKAAGRPRLLFGNQSFQGYYNALLNLLDDKRSGQMLGYGPEQDQDGREYPTVWISVIGHNGAITPVYKAPLDMTLKGLGGGTLRQQCRDAHVLARAGPDRGGKADASGPAPAARPDDLTGTRRFSTLLVCGLCAVTGWLLWFLFRGLTDLARPKAAGAAAAPDAAAESSAVGPPASRPDLQRWRLAEDAAAKAVQRLCLAGMCFCAGCMYGWLFSIALMTSVFDFSDLWSRGAIINRFVLGLAFGACAAIGYFFVTRCLLQARRARSAAASRPGGAARILVSLEWLLHAAIAACFFVVIAIMIWASLAFMSGQPAYASLYFERAVHFGAGLSPLLPATLLAVALAAWCYFFFKKFHYLRHHAVHNPFDLDPALDAYTRLKAFGDQVEKTIRPLYRPDGATPPAKTSYAAQFGRWAPPAAGVLVIGAVFWQLDAHWIPTIEHWLFDWLMFVGLLIGVSVTAFVSLYFYLVWSKLRDLLKELAKLPLGKAFGRLPATVRRIVDGALYANRPGHSALSLARQQWMSLALTWPQARDAVAKDTGPAAGDELAAVDQLVKEAPPPDADSTPADDQKTELRLRQAFAALLPILHRVWQSRSLAENFAPPADAKPDAAAAPDAKADAGAARDADRGRRWLDGAEDFVAVEVTRYLSHYFAQLRNLLNAMVLGAFLLVLSITVYPFNPQRLLLLYTVVLLGSVAGLAVWVLIAINRDEVMSRLAGSAPNRFTPDTTFLKEMVQYVLPIVGLLMVQFPAVGSLVRSVLEPVLQLMR